MRPNWRSATDLLPRRSQSAAGSDATAPTALKPPGEPLKPTPKIPAPRATRSAIWSPSGNGTSKIVWRGCSISSSRLNGGNSGDCFWRGWPRRDRYAAPRKLLLVVGALVRPPLWSQRRSPRAQPTGMSATTADDRPPCASAGTALTKETGYSMDDALNNLWTSTTYRLCRFNTCETKLTA